jgi:hypothetical protein
MMTGMTSTLRLVLVALLTAACGGALQYDLRGTQLSPGSDGKLEAEVDVTRNLTKLDIRAANLTPPERVLEGGTLYVVWTRRDDHTPWLRLGALELSDEGRKGSALLTVSEVAFDLQISVETTAEVASPSGKTVFEQRIQR